MSKIVATNRGDHLSDALIKHIIYQMRGGDLPPALMQRLGSAADGGAAAKRRRKKKYQVSLEDIGGGPESEHYKSIS